MTRSLDIGYIGKDLRARGKLEGEIDVRIEGRFEGDLRIGGRVEIGHPPTSLAADPDHTESLVMTRPSIFPTGAAFIGAIDGDGDVVVLGSLEGNVTIEGDLVIEQSGCVRGEVRARTVTVRGVLEGPARATGFIAVEEGATAFGDLTAPRIRIVEGARFRGRLTREHDELALDETSETIVVRRTPVPEPAPPPSRKPPPLVMPVPRGSAGRFRG